MIAVYGIPRTGKGKWVIDQIQQKRASLVWDLKDDPREYPCKWRVRNLTALRIVLARNDGGMICYSSGNEADFDEFCVIAKLFAEKWGNDGAVVLDETSDITGTGKATGNYGQLLRKALNLGADIYTVCQRAAESDKTSFANATRFHFSTVGTQDDIQRMSKALGIPLAVVHGLTPDFEKNTFDCIDCVKGHWYQVSQLQFKKGRAVFVPKSEKTHFYKK